MTTTTAPAPAATTASKVGMSHLIRSELLKIRTVNTWWIFLICTVVFTVLPLVLWIWAANDSITTAAGSADEPFVPEPDVPPAVNELNRQQWEINHDLGRALINNAAQIYTGGQYFGLLFALLLGTLLMTNEYYHQTATATFLTTPHRTQVITGKLITAMMAAGFFWIFTTAIDIAAGATFFSIKGHGTQLDQWPVQRAILLNLLAFALWGVLGIGLGVLIRSQIGAVLTGSLSYVIGTFLISNIAALIFVLTGQSWVLDVQVLWPGVASQVMISPEQPFPDAPEWWVGALVLAGWGILFGVIGTLITRKRDIS